MEQLSLELILNHVIKIILRVLPHADRLSSPLDRIRRGVHDTASSPRALACLVLSPVMVRHDPTDKARCSGLDCRQNIWQALLHHTGTAAQVYQLRDILDGLGVSPRLNMLDGPVLAPNRCVIKCIHDLLSIFKHLVYAIISIEEGWKQLLIGGEGRVEPWPSARFQQRSLDGDLRGLLMLLLSQSTLDESVGYLMPVSRLHYLGIWL